MMEGASLTCSAILRGHEERVWHVSWSLDGNLLASCSSDRSVRVWQRRADGQWSEVSRLEDAHERTVRCCEWSPCGRLIAAVSFDATCAVWRRCEGEEGSAVAMEWEILATLEGHENEVKGAAWNASTTLLATCGRDKSVWLWEFVDDENFELLTVLHGHGGDVKAVAFDPAGAHEDDLLASCSYDETVRVWGDDGDDWSCRATLEGHSSTVWAVRFCAKRPVRTLVSCGDDRAVLVWEETSTDGSAWRLAARLDDVHARAAYSLDCHPGGAPIVATAGGDNALALLSLETQKDGSTSLAKRATLPNAHDADINCVRWNPNDPTTLATASDDFSVKVWTLGPVQTRAV